MTGDKDFNDPWTDNVFDDSLDDDVLFRGLGSTGESSMPTKPMQSRYPARKAPTIDFSAPAFVNRWTWKRLEAAEGAFTALEGAIRAYGGAMLAYAEVQVMVDNPEAVQSYAQDVVGYRFLQAKQRIEEAKKKHKARMYRLDNVIDRERDALGRPGDEESAEEIVRRKEEYEYQKEKVRAEYRKKRAKYHMENTADILNYIDTKTVERIVFLCKGYISESELRKAGIESFEGFVDFVDDHESTPPNIKDNIIDQAKNIFAAAQAQKDAAIEE